MKLNETLATKWGTAAELSLFFFIALSTAQPGITIPLLIIIYVISVKTRHLKWIDVGIDRTTIKFRNILIAILIAAGYQLLFHNIIDPVIDKLFPPADLDTFGDMKGNIQLLALWLLVTWTVAAVLEEVLFRGYLVNRLLDLLGGNMVSRIITVILAGIPFGFAHLYQGMHGAATAIIFGILQSTLFLLAGRKLFIPMITHGTFDSISFILLYMGIVY